MTLVQSELAELLDALRARVGIDVIRQSVEVTLQALIEAEATTVIRLARTSAARTAPELAPPEAVVDQAGDLQRSIPKVEGSYLSPEFAPRWSRRRVLRQSTVAARRVRGGPAYLPVVTRVTTGQIRQHFPDGETDEVHVDGRSNTGCTDSNTLPR